MKPEKMANAAKIIADRVVVLSGGVITKRWDKNAGQYLVYGLERYIGFHGGVFMCAEVERAWKLGQPIEPVILNALKECLEET